MLETMSLLGVVLDPAGRVVFVNDFALQLTGWTRDEVLGHAWLRDSVPAEEAAAFRDTMPAQISAGAVVAQFESELLSREGGPRMIAWNNTVLRDADGRVTGVASIGQDVTEHRRAEEAQAAATVALRESEERLRRVLSGVDAIIAFQTAAGDPLYLSDAVERVLGVSADDVNSFDEWQALVHPDDIERCRAVWSTNIPSWALTYRMRRADGTWVWVDDRGRKLPGGPGQAPGVFGVISDATGRREGEERLRISEEWLRAVLDGVDAIIGYQRHADAPVENSSGAARILGYSPETTSRFGQWRELIHPDDLDRCTTMWDSSAETWSLEYRMRRADGAWIWVEDRGRRVRADSEHGPGLFSVVVDVTKRREVEERLRFSESQLRTVLDGVDAIISSQTSAEAPIIMNSALERILGHPAATIRSFDEWNAIVHPDDLEAARAKWNGPTGSWDTEYRVRHADGTWRWVNDHGRRISSDEPGMPGMFSVVVDVTGRREATDRARAMEARFRAVFEENPESIGICTPVLDSEGHFSDARLVLANRVARERWLGGAGPDSKDAPLMFASFPSLRGPLFEAAVAVIERGESRRVESHLASPGHDFWSETSLFPFEDGFAFVGRDISARKRAEADAARSLAQFRRIQDSGIVGMVITERDGRVVEANDYWLNLVGRTRAELERGEVNWREATAPEYLARDDADYDALRGDVPAVPYETQYVRPDGTRVPALVVRTTMPGPEDRTSSITIDMTRQHADRQELDRLAAAIRQTSESVVMTDLTANILYVNPAFERITGYTLEEVTGHNPRILKSGIQPDPFYRKLWATLSAGETWQGELVNRRKDGSLFTEEASITPIKDEAGETTGYVAVKRDVTAEQERAAALRQAQRLESVGQLASGIAHDFNNYLAAIRGYGEVVLASLEPGTGIEQDMVEVLRAAERATALTRQLLTFSRGQQGPATATDPGEAVDNMVPLLRGLVGERVLIVSNHTPGIAWVNIDRSQYEQIVMNLVVNARDATTDGDTITIELALPPRDEGAAMVRLTVADTGAGMAPEVLSRVFEPFFTTKEMGKGTGMGLATVHGIVRRAGGQIAAESAPGHGSRFIVDLPEADDPAPTGGSATAAEQPAAPRGSGARVLLVEDDAAIRPLLARQLVRLGYTVTQAGSGAEALERVRASGGAPDLLVSDVRMPGMLGTELARRIRAQHPNLPILFISGFSADIPDDLRAAPLVRVLDKPFDVDTFGAAIRESLAATR